MENQVIDENYNSSSRKVLPNASATLVLGILALVFSFCCWSVGLIGITLSIVALAISTKPVKMYNENPSGYEGYGNLKAGRIMAIIALCLSSVYMVFIIIYALIVGVAAFSFHDIFNQLNF